MNLGKRSMVITMLFAILIGWLSIWFLTKSLRIIIYHVNKFKEGNLSSRIPNAEKSDLSELAVTYNAMAQTISDNIHEIESVNKFRKELLAHVSHDLRTPLTVIRGYVETLKMKGDSLEKSDRKEFMDIIEKSAFYLSDMVTDLFEYSKLETKKIAVNKIPFSITDLVMCVKERCHVLALEKNIKLEVSIDGEIPLVYADAGLIERVIQNIIDNAMKFTPNEGEIIINVFEKQDEVYIRIQDNGLGIGKQTKKIILNGGNRITLSGNNGVGLGLAIVKKIMDLHDTQMEVESNVNEGSTFQFTLPTYNVKLVL